MSTINPKFLDVDFTKDPRYVCGYQAVGDHRCLAYADSTDLIPESEWRELVALIDAGGGGADRLVTRIYDQKNEGSCVANACSQGHEILQAKQLGRDRVTHLSAMSLYKRIGSSPNSGAMVSDGMDEMSERGILPLDNPENRARFGDKVMPNTGWRTAMPSGWEDVAKLFRLDERRVITSVNEMMTALIKQEPVIVGREGHSICYVRPMWDGRWVVKYANSWGDWGEKGYGFDSLNQIKKSSGWAFALQSIVT